MFISPQSARLTQRRHHRSRSRRPCVRPLQPDTRRPPKRPRATPPRELLPEPGSWEEALVNAYSLLQSAAATAYENADNQSGSNRKVAMGVVHLIEMAQLWMDSVLDKRMNNASS